MSTVKLETDIGIGKTIACLVFLIIGGFKNNKDLFLAIVTMTIRKGFSIMYKTKKPENYSGFFKD